MVCSTMTQRLRLTPMTASTTATQSSLLFSRGLMISIKAGTQPQTMTSSTRIQ